VLVSPNSYTVGNSPLPDSDEVENIQILKGASASVIYGSAAAEGAIIVTTKKHSRGAFASELNGQFVNPAVEFSFDLDGESFGGSSEVCIDIGRIMPLSLNFEYSGYDLSGSGSLSGLNFSEGFGLPGIGGLPGVYNGFPTDLTEATLDVDRHGYNFEINLGMPLSLTVNGGGSKDDDSILPSILDIRQLPSLGVTSTYFGLRAGTLEQSENTRFYADTPAYNPISAWMGDYRTEFDGNYFGVSAGLGYDHTFYMPDNTSLTFGLKGFLSYDCFDFDVHEGIYAEGLNLGTLYSNEGNHSFTDGLFSTSLSASVEWKRDNLTIGAFATYSTGAVPEINRFLPDSDNQGALDPEYSLSSSSSVGLGLSARYRF